jgi:hypothetical protein
MSAVSAAFANLLAGVLLLGCWIGGLAMIVSVAAFGSDPWLLLLAALFLWMGWTGVANLRAWYGRIPERKVQATADGLVIDGVALARSAIRHVKLEPIVTTKKTNFVKAGTDYTLLVSIERQDGRLFLLRAGQGPVTWHGPSYGRESCRRLLQKLRTAGALQ